MSKRVAVVIEYAQMVVPAGEVGHLGPAEQACLVTLMKWANDPAFRRFPEPLPRIPLVWGSGTFESISEEISGITERPQPYWWWPAFLISSALLTGGVLGSHYQDIFAFIVLIIVLTLRPSGIMGERVADRA